MWFSQLSRSKRAAQRLARRRTRERAQQQHHRATRAAAWCIEVAGKSNQILLTNLYVGWKKFCEEIQELLATNEPVVLFMFNAKIRLFQGLKFAGLQDTHGSLAAVAGDFRGREWETSLFPGGRNLSRIKN